MDFIRSAFLGSYVPVVNCLKLPALTLRVEVENCLQDTCSTPRRIEVPEKTDVFSTATKSAKTKLGDVEGKQHNSDALRFETWQESLPKHRYLLWFGSFSDTAFAPCHPFPFAPMDTRLDG